MKSVSATKVRRRFGEYFTLADNDSLLIETRGTPTHRVFTAPMGLRLVLGAFASGAISRAEAMDLLGFEWYGQLLDAMRENGIDRGDAVLDSGSQAALDRAMPVIEEALSSPNLTKATDDDVRLDELFRQLSAGEISRREFEEATGKEWWWGDILEGLGRRKLPYPTAEIKRTEDQRRLADKVL